MYETMLLIRRVEEKLLELFSEGVLHGTTHTSIGQEACSVGVLSAIDRGRDVVVSNHRCHGHFLAYGGPLEGLFAELMGRSDGVCRGIGGSQHLHWRSFYSNGVLGGTAPMALGIGLAERLSRTGAVVVNFLGDGALGEGAVYESLNMASLWGVPIVYAIEANGVAQATPIALELAGEIAARPRAFGIETIEIDAGDPGEVRAAVAPLVSRARAESRPGCVVLRTFRLGPHSKGDDPRPREEIAAAAARDPLNRWLASLPPVDRERLEDQVRARIEAALAQARASSPLDGRAFDEAVGIGA
jgi:acetoin:2,6-dichlorophenolindophenol oxidoreductase subunit alpha